MNIGQKLAYAAFVSLLFATLVISESGCVIAADLTGIAASADEIQPVKTGQMAPKFTVRTVDDEPFVFDPENLDAPAILITFRGGWCPFCNMHLSELKDVVPAIKDKGIDIYFLSGDRPELLYASLKLETQEEIAGLGYTILSDANIDAARALGLAFKTSDATIEGREKRGQDIEGSSMRNFGVLPVPAVYVIDASGKVTYSFVEPDYKVRLPADDLLQAANDVAN
jgi:peroxiredoxin